MGSSRRLAAFPLTALALAVAAGGCAHDQVAARAAARGEGIVVAVTDGDTVRVRVAGRTERVRLIGIDTPETHGQGGLRECFGREAAARAAELLPPGSTVRLVRDAEPRDRYGRLLAYVYDDDGTFVNLRLAAEGFAAPLAVAPNVAHRDTITTAAAEARQAGRGLWGACGGPDTPIRRIAPLPSPP